MQCHMEDLHSLKAKFHGYHFSVEFVPIEDWKVGMVASDGRPIETPNDVWCSRSSALFLPLENEIEVVGSEQTVRRDAYVTWQLEQADDLFLLRVASKTFAWRKKIAKLLEIDQYELENQGLAVPQFLCFENVTEARPELGCLLIQYLRSQHAEMFYELLVDACLNLINGFHIGLVTNISDVGLATAIAEYEVWDFSICVVGEGRMTTAFSKTEGTPGTGLSCETNEARYVSVRNDNEVPKDIDKYLKEESDRSLSSFIEFVEEQEEKSPSHGMPVMRSYSTWSIPPRKIRGSTPEHTADIRVGRPVRYP